MPIKLMGLLLSIAIIFVLLDAWVDGQQGAMGDLDIVTQFRVFKMQSVEIFGISTPFAFPTLRGEWLGSLWNLLLWNHPMFEGWMGLARWGLIPLTFMAVVGIVVGLATVVVQFVNAIRLR